VDVAAHLTPSPAQDARRDCRFYAISLSEAVKAWKGLTAPEPKGRGRWLNLDEKWVKASSCFRKGSCGMKNPIHDLSQSMPIMKIVCDDLKFKAPRSNPY